MAVVHGHSGWKALPMSGCDVVDLDGVAATDGHFGAPGECRERDHHGRRRAADSEQAASADEPVAGRTRPAMTFLSKVEDQHDGDHCPQGRGETDDLEMAEPALSYRGIATDRWHDRWAHSPSLWNAERRRHAGIDRGNEGLPALHARRDDVDLGAFLSDDLSASVSPTQHRRHFAPLDATRLVADPHRQATPTDHEALRWPAEEGRGREA